MFKLEKKIERSFDPIKRLHERQDSQEILNGCAGEIKTVNS